MQQELNQIYLKILINLRSSLREGSLVKTKRLFIKIITKIFSERIIKFKIVNLVNLEILMNKNHKKFLNNYRCKILVLIKVFSISK